MVVGIIGVALPLGMASAVYLSEYARQGRLTRLIRMSILTLAGVPSIVFGLFGLGLFVLLCNFGASILAGLVTGVVCFAMSPATYWNLSLIATADVVQGVVKALTYGVAVPIVSGACGLAARGGARGVGQATTDAVVGSSFAIVALDSLISMIAHLATGGS